MFALALLLLACDTGARGAGFDPARASVLAEFAWPGRPVASVAFSPDGRTLAVSVADESVRLWSVRPWKEVRAVPSPGSRIGQVAFSGDGRRLLAYDANRRVLRVFDVAEGAERGQVPDVVDSLFAFAPGPDGRRIAVATRGACRLYDPDTAAETAVLPGRADGTAVTAIFWSRGGGRIAAVQREVRIYDAADSRELYALPADGGTVVGVAFGPGLRAIATTETTGKIKLWDGADGRLLKSAQGHEGQVESVAWSPEGRWLATGGRDGTLRIWNPPDLREVRRWEAHRGSVYIVRFSPDGRTLVTGGRDGKLKAWGTR